MARSVSKSKSRPHFYKGIVELEKILEASPQDRTAIDTLLDELRHRSTDRAKRLQARCAKALEALNDTRATPSTRSDASAKEKSKLVQSENEPSGFDEGQAQWRETATGNGPGQDAEPEFGFDFVELMGGASSGNTSEASEEDNTPSEAFWEQPVEPDAALIAKIRQRPLENKPTDIVDAWTALEVLSPQTFARPEDLSGGERYHVAQFDNTRLPWEIGRDRARPSTKLFYHVVIGAIRIDLAAAELLKSFGDARPERPRTKAMAALAAITVDKQGRPIEENATAVSSFGYGYAQVRSGKLETLGNWPAIERELNNQLARRLTRHVDGEIQPLTRDMISGAFTWLADGFGIPNAQRVEPYFAIRVYHFFLNRKPPEPLLLNSFFLQDLAKCRDLAEGGNVGAALGRYLEIIKPETQTDLLSDKDALRRLVEPGRAPLARWPSKGLHSLVLLQQAAVNLIFDELGSATGIASVNGPPGTGKTTLLRDLVAGVVMNRAEALCEFETPEDAFAHADNARWGQAFLHMYEMDPALRGHEIVVASSNNKAVENVTREIPAREAVEEVHAPRYFASVADNVAEKDGAAWGLAAAVLGNASNRFQFYSKFWKDEDRGLKTYLWAASGNPKKILKQDPETGEDVETIPYVVEHEKPPSDPAQAMKRWKSACSDFRKTMRAARSALDALQRTKDALADLSAVEQATEAALAELEAALDREDEAKFRHADAKAALADAQARRNRGAEILTSTRSARPGLLARLFRSRAWRAWTTLFREQSATLQKLDAELRERVRLADEAETFLTDCESEAVSANEMAIASRNRMLALQAKIAAGREALGRHFADEAFWNQGHADLQVSVPWLDAQVQGLRDQCFASAISLHRAFIDAAAKPIRNNLNALLSILIGSGLDSEKEQLLPSLWSTLFLVTPVVSTTFASVGRMFAPMPPESIGWLMIDEAGQALPQAAAGAIMRAKRAVVVGDPFQLEPVVTLPLSLGAKLCGAFGVNPLDWSAPGASCQALADRASTYSGWYEKAEGASLVGAPLLVHRRCADPMFSISNRISYSGLMVNATPGRVSSIRDALGPSCWIDIDSSGSGKWSPEEGDTVVELLERLLSCSVTRPDIFVITPFRLSSAGLRRRLRAEPNLLEGLGYDVNEFVYERCGTVYTFQGKEAEGVICVLGASGPDQEGARRWAGSPPNQVNVAVSRAKDALYVVGNRSAWRNHGAFTDVARSLPDRSAS